MLKKLAGYSPIPFSEDHTVVKSHCSCFHLKLKCFFVIGAVLLTIILVSWLSYSSHGVRSPHSGTLQFGGRVGHQGYDDGHPVVTVPRKGNEPAHRLLNDFKSSRNKFLLSTNSSEDRQDADKALISNAEIKEQRFKEFNKIKEKQTNEELDELKEKQGNVEQDETIRHNNNELPVDEHGFKGKNGDYYDSRDDNTEDIYDTDSQNNHHVSLLKHRLPKCILIGVSKAGTSALLFFLNMHPKIRIAQKEVHFFDLMHYYNQGIEWYKEQMPLTYADQITIEKTPSYFVSFRVPSRVHKVDSTMKLMVIVREPVSRAVSQYLLMRKRSDRQNLPLPSFETLAIDPVTGGINSSFKAVRSSVYYDYMVQWLQYFSRDQIHIVDGDNLRKVPWDEIKKVESFLEVDHLISKERFVWNETKQFYCFLMDSGEENCLPDYKGRIHPHIDPEVIQKLKDYYRPRNEKFFKLVGQRFDWD